jgi:hypothetical protein
MGSLLNLRILSSYLIPPYAKLWIERDDLVLEKDNDSADGSLGRGAKQNQSCRK